MHLCTKKLRKMQTKYALKIIKYAFLVNKNTKICTTKFITIHKTKILYFYYPVVIFIYYVFYYNYNYIIINFNLYYYLLFINY